MALADDIRALRDRVLADLNSAHDYYTDTKIAWNTVHEVIAAGHTFSIRNMITGTMTTEAQLTSKARGYRHKEGQRIDIPEHYHRGIWELIRKVVTDVSDAAIAKVR